MDKTVLYYTLALQRIPNLGDITAKKLLKVFGSAEAIFKADKRELTAVNGIGKHKIKGLHEDLLFKEAEAEMQFIEKNHIKVRYFEDADYPSQLKHCIDAPILLFERGNINLQHKRMISIVGTRKATQHGLAFCEAIIEKLAPLNPVIVSGFAYGIDICAHKAAMNYGLQTLACLGHGLDQIYPKAHQVYQRKLEEHGGFVTDFWSQSTFDRKNFLRRNRIIAGMTEATIVIESAHKGGSLVTADIANSYNREVFAVPGRVTDKLSVGCNNLIKSEQARMLTCAEDLIYMLNWDIEQKPAQQQRLFEVLTPEEEKVVAELQQHKKMNLDDLALSLQLSTHQLTGVLLSLELKGCLRPLPGKQYEII